MSIRRLVLSREDRVIFGLCGGLADRIGVDPVVVRLGTVVLAMVGFAWLVPVYFVAGLAMRNRSSGDWAAATRRATHKTAVSLGWMMVVVGAFVALQRLHHFIDTALVVALVALVVGINVVLRHRD